MRRIKVSVSYLKVGDTFVVGWNMHKIVKITRSRIYTHFINEDCEDVWGKEELEDRNFFLLQEYKNTPKEAI